MVKPRRFIRINPSPSHTRCHGIDGGVPLHSSKRQWLIPAQLECLESQVVAPLPGASQCVRIPSARMANRSHLLLLCTDHSRRLRVRLRSRPHEKCSCHDEGDTSTTSRRNCVRAAALSSIFAHSPRGKERCNNPIQRRSRSWRQCRHDASSDGLHIIAPKKAFWDFALRVADCAGVGPLPPQANYVIARNSMSAGLRFAASSSRAALKYATAAPAPRFSCSRR